MEKMYEPQKLNLTNEQKTKILQALYEVWGMEHGLELVNFSVTFPDE